MEELNTVKREITARSVVLQQMHPQYAGAALWAKGLKRRIERLKLGEEKKIKISKNKKLISFFFFFKANVDFEHGSFLAIGWCR